MHTLFRNLGGTTKQQKVKSDLTTTLRKKYESLSVIQKVYFDVGTM